MYYIELTLAPWSEGQEKEIILLGPFNTERRREKFLNKLVKGFEDLNSELRRKFPDRHTGNEDPIGVMVGARTSSFIKTRYRGELSLNVLKDLRERYFEHLLSTVS